MNNAVELALFLIAFGMLWVCALAAASLLGGWYSLTKRFRAHQALEGLRFGLASMNMGPRYFPASYSNCLTVRVSEHGIGLKVWPMFAVLHPPLLIPWTDVDDCRRESVLLFFPCTSVYVSDVRDPLRFFAKSGRAIEIAWEYRRSEHDRRSTAEITA